VRRERLISCGLNLAPLSQGRPPAREYRVRFQRGQ
jgi:hypothetical protein